MRNICAKVIIFLTISRLNITQDVSDAVNKLARTYPDYLIVYHQGYANISVLSYVSGSEHAMK